MTLPQTLFSIGLALLVFSLCGLLVEWRARRLTVMARKSILLKMRAALLKSARDSTILAIIPDPKKLEIEWQPVTMANFSFVSREHRHADGLIHLVGRDPFPITAEHADLVEHRYQQAQEDYLGAVQSIWEDQGEQAGQQVRWREIGPPMCYHTQRTPIQPGHAEEFLGVLEELEKSSKKKGAKK